MKRRGEGEGEVEPHLVQQHPIQHGDGARQLGALQRRQQVAPLLLLPTTSTSTSALAPRLHGGHEAGEELQARQEEVGHLRRGVDGVSHLEI